MSETDHAWALTWVGGEIPSVDQGNEFGLSSLLELSDWQTEVNSPHGVDCCEKKTAAVGNWGDFGIGSNKAHEQSQHKVETKEQLEARDHLPEYQVLKSYEGRTL